MRSESIKTPIHKTKTYQNTNRIHVLWYLTKPTHLSNNPYISKQCSTLVRRNRINNMHNVKIPPDNDITWSSQIPKYPNQCSNFTQDLFAFSHFYVSKYTKATGFIFPSSHWIIVFLTKIIDWVCKPFMFKVLLSCMVIELHALSITHGQRK